MTPSASPVATVVVGTRRSALARQQTARVIDLLTDAWPELVCEERQIVTRGDRTQESGEPLPEIGGKGLFTAELEQGLRDGEIDLAVHSLKDLPTEGAADMTIGAVCLREDVRDCVIASRGLLELSPGAVVGTSSLRRAAQVRALRPDLEVRSIRGNVDTRIRKVRDGELDAAVLAAAGISRLGREDAVAEWLTPETMLPAPGQGALAVQCRAGDERVLELLAAIDDADARATTTAERAFLRVLEAGCTAPVGAYAEVEDGRVRLRALVLSPDGQEIVRVEGGGEPEDVGARLAREALAAGADEILAELRGDPLRGRRIVVTRPVEQAAPLAGALERLGATVVRVPLVAIEPMRSAQPAEEIADLTQYDWIVFTSANGVSALRARFAESSALEGVRVAAVGPATAEAVRSLGIEPAFVPERFAAEEIVEGLGPLTDAHVLLPQADLADPLLAETLRARGARVDAFTAYRTVRVEPPAAELAELVESPDAILVASGSAAQSLASLAAAIPSLRGSVEDALLVYIGPKTARVAGELGLPDGLVAEEATADGIIHALTSHFGGAGHS
jgi:hydroxymethylbilane synthase